MKNKRTLQIVRHAKSSWDYDSLSDIDRPLKLRGIKNAYEMARRLKIRNSLPKLILTSPANRALHTAIIFARVFELPFANLNIEVKLYETGEERLLDLLKHIPDEVNSVMLVGHNPVFTNFANLFVSTPIANIPTAGIVTIAFEAASWQDISREKVKTENSDFPAN